MKSLGVFPTSFNRKGAAQNGPSRAGAATPKADPPQKSGPGVPLLLHFDVNKTIIQSDSIQLKSIEDGVREGISELFWGRVRGDKVWEWNKSKPTCHPPTEITGGVSPSQKSKPVNYGAYCKDHVKDKVDRKQAIRSFKLLRDADTTAEMEKLVQTTLKKMQFNSDTFKTGPGVRRPSTGSSGSKDELALGRTIKMFPALFQLIAVLTRSKRPFAILFRSFGHDHEKIIKEWNAFCEMRHPFFSHLLEGLGPLDGTQPNAPDRRIRNDQTHTMYRDSAGPMLILDTFTNGPGERSWDSWAKGKNKPKIDDRNGREFVQKLGAQTVEGIPNIQKWMRQLLIEQRTAAIKDDWAWWQWNDEKAEAGKLMTIIPSTDADSIETKQLFFDDNVDHEDARIVDCRGETGGIVPLDEGLNRHYCKVNPVEAVLDDHYFLRKLQRCHGDMLDMGEGELIEYNRRLMEAEDERNELRRQVQALQSQIQQVSDENKRIKFKRKIDVESEAHLTDLLSWQDNIDTNTFGTDGYHGISNLYNDLEQGLCWLERDDDNHIVRVLDMVFLRVIYKDMILVQYKEQDSLGNTSTRNYLPGIIKSTRDTVEQVLDRWLEAGLEVNLKTSLTPTQAPIFRPEAPDHKNRQTAAYPMPCRVQQNVGSYIIHQGEVDFDPEKLLKIGLPSLVPFSTTEGISGAKSILFWKWEKAHSWEAGQFGGAGAKEASGHFFKVTDVCQRIFRNNPNKDVYETMITQMFEAFNAQKLAGGFSGSLVVRVNPLDQDGRPAEPCIVKFDKEDAIREEYKNSKNVFQALPDRAARILGDAVYGTDHEGKGFGAMRLELAGACWNVPELAQQGSGNVLCTFKELLLFEGEQVLLGGAASTEGRPFGNVNTVLAETFGAGGAVSSMRNGTGGLGLRRDDPKNPPLTAHYTLKGKTGEFNPYTAKKGEYPPTEAMRKLFRKYFGFEMPDLKTEVVEKLKSDLDKLTKTVSLKEKQDIRPLIALAHGDLNAANIMIDMLDAVWLIDFATSVDLPLFTDMCKFEMACLFEYSAIPITPKYLVEFASTDADKWGALNVGDWLRVDQEIVVALLHELIKIPQKLDNITEAELHRLIEETVRKTAIKPAKQNMAIRVLKARLCAAEENMDRAFQYCKAVSQAFLKGDFILDTLLPHRTKADEYGQGALSVGFFVDTCVTIRKFMYTDILGCFRDLGRKQINFDLVDAMSLQLYLPFLRESFRIMGYRDISPQHKIWSAYHCHIVGQNVAHAISMLNSNLKQLKKLPPFIDLHKKLQDSEPSSKRPTRQNEHKDDDEHFTEAESHWIYAHEEMLTNTPAQKADPYTRVAHANCSRYRAKAGFFMPIYRVCQPPGNKPIDVEIDNAVQSGALEIVVEHKMAKEIGTGTTKHTIGYLKSKGPQTYTATLKSRLYMCSLGLLQQQLTSFQAYRDNKKKIDDFDLTDWLGTEVQVGKSASGTKRMAKPTRPAGGKREAERTVSSPDVEEETSAPLCLTLEATVIDSSGKDVQKLHIMFGAPTFCYPPGAKLCLDLSVEQGRQPEVVVWGLQDAGNYRIADAQPGGEKTQMGTERDFDPTPTNHVYLEPAVYHQGAEVTFKDEDSRHGQEWVNAHVLEEPSENTQWRYRLRLGAGVTKTMSSVIVPERQKKRDDDSSPEAREIYRHMNQINSGETKLTSNVFEEQVQSVKNYFKARFSYTMDALSGARLDVKDFVPFTLHIKTDSDTDIANARNTNVSPKKGSNPLARDGMIEDPRMGWLHLNNTIKKYGNTTPTCMPVSFLILGSPGSGKSCLLCRLLMDTLETQKNMIPLLLRVDDLVKRSSETPDKDEKVWFDKYLRITFGEDSQRYHMLKQAIDLHRVMFLFEGLEDGGSLTPVIERCIIHYVLHRHLVVVTSRPATSGSSMLEDMSAYMTTTTLQQLSMEHMRGLAQQRLGSDGAAAFNSFFDKNQEQQEVFGNPLMLSMLVCYLGMRKQKEKEAADKAATADAANKENDDNEGITLTAVYRVAIGVMLQRVQSRQQSQRHEAGDRVDMAKKILAKIGLVMQQAKVEKMDLNDVDQHLESKPMKDSWDFLKKNVLSGHAILLRMSNEGGKPEFQFLVKSFQDFFAADCLKRENVFSGLPVLDKLLVEPWWKQMLEMVSEHAPTTYVSMIEDRLRGPNRTKDGPESFLHIAAQVGHKPVFVLLKQFKEQYQAALMSTNVEKQTPLHVAAMRGHSQICTMMLEHKASLTEVDDMDRLPIHGAMEKGHYTTAEALLGPWVEKHQTKNANVENLATKVVGTMREADFQDKCKKTFLELGYFAQSPKDRQKVLISIMSVYWIANNQYEQFTAMQNANAKLTRASWDKLTEWAKNAVGVTSKVDVMRNMFVVLAIAGLAKIPGLKDAFAPNYENPTDAIASILKKSPILVPSFYHLNQNVQNYLLEVLKFDSEFNLGQFLQGENLPGNLATARGSQSQDDQSSGAFMNFYFFYRFCTLCGVMGGETSQGATMMTQPLFTNFDMGRLALTDADNSVQGVFDRFLAERARGQGLSFSPSGPTRAIVRLACLSRIFTPPDAKMLHEAFHALQLQDQKKLSEYLNADGVQQKAFMLFYIPNFLAKFISDNREVGMTRALQLMLQVFITADKEYGKSTQKIITINCETLPSKDLTDPEKFDFTKFTIRRKVGSQGDKEGSIHLYKWQLETNSEVLATIKEVGETLVDDMFRGSLREPAFLKLVQQVIPELGYFQNAPKLLDQTKCALLVVYWVVTAQHEAFTRAQSPSDRLASNSWSFITKWFREHIIGDKHKHEVVHAMLVAIVLNEVGKIPSLGTSLAPGVSGHQHIMRHVIETSPKVFPSFHVLGKEMQELVAKTTTLAFDFVQFLQAENLPANLVVVNKMRHSSYAYGDLTAVHMFQFNFFCMFAAIAGSDGETSLEGATAMDNMSFTSFKTGLDEIEKLQDNERDIYDNYLISRATTLGLQFDEEAKQGVRKGDAKTALQRAIVRLSCMCKCKDGVAAMQIITKFRELDLAKQTALAKHLNNDGVEQKLAFILLGSPQFLEQAARTDDVKLKPAFCILLRIYEKASETFRGAQQVVQVHLGKLVEIVGDSFGILDIADLPFEIVKRGDYEGEVHPKVWIPVNTPSVLEELNGEAKQLASDMLGGAVMENEFKTRIKRIFPELRYFSSTDLLHKDRTLLSMNSVFWLVTNKRDDFVKCQPEGSQLSKHSWNDIQEWMQKSTKLVTAEAIDAMLVITCIHALGKIQEFRNDLAKSCEGAVHEEALSHILQTQAQVVPSFARLSQKYRDLIIDSIGVDFDFSQFLQAENIPSNLVVIKEKLHPHGDEGFAFFCFRIFAQMCGREPEKSQQKGSFFMTEYQYTRFRPGLEVIRGLRTSNATEAYDMFLLNRGSKALSCFASPEHQALTRLLCLSSSFDRRVGAGPCDAFRLSLDDAERQELSYWLTLDGINKKPGLVLPRAEKFFKSAGGNQHVGYPAAMRMLLESFRLISMKDAQGLARLTLDLNELGTWAQEAGPGEFSKAELSLRPRHAGDTSTLNVVVDRLSTRQDTTSRRRCCDGKSLKRFCLCCLFLMAFFSLLSGAGLLMQPTYEGLLPRHVRESVPARPAHVAFGVATVAIFLAACLSCCVRSPVRIRRTVPRFPMQVGEYRRVSTNEDVV